MSGKKECIYRVRGMHCASCEILIEKKLLGVNNIKAVEASTAKGEVVIESDGEQPNLEQLNRLFSKDNYIFSHISQRNEPYVINLDNAVKTIGIAAAVLIGFFLLSRLGFGKYANADASSSLPVFFVMGLIAGVSTCAALVGGIILSVSKQWMEHYAEENSTRKKMQPHIMFNLGRAASYAFFGALLGALGSKLQISLKFSSFLILTVSIIMGLTALQMLGIRAFHRFQFTLPKFVTRHIANEKNFQGRYMPALMGALTFFLPCGFTITAQGIALLAGDAIQSALIMLFFALGTAPALLAIGLTSVKLSGRPHLAGQFTKVAGTIVLFFALYNINAQMTVLGWGDFSGFLSKISTKTDASGLPPIVNGKQMLRMEASARGYKPNYFKVRANTPVRWEIKDTGTSGCTNAVISRLFSGSIDLTPGQTAIKEFIPRQTGRFRFSCWMGMVSGIIEVVE